MRVSGSSLRRGLLSAAIALLVLFSSHGLARAQWSNNPAINTPVCVQPNVQLNSVAVGDGAGGAIVAWVDNRGVNPADIYVQRLNIDGVAQWAAGGVAVCTALGNQSNAAITSDGAGGAIIAWQDFRGGSYDIYAQRVSAAGVPLWAAGGVPVGTAANDQIWPMLVPDGANGAIVTWEDNRAGGLNYDIYAQRVNNAGVAQWPPLAGGVPICVQPNWQAMPMIVSDGAGGAIITWYDVRSGVDDDIYAQRVTFGGATLWAPNGQPVCGAPTGIGDRQTQPTIASDGANGAIITWYDYRSTTNWDIYAQRIDAIGAIQWGPAAVGLCTAPNDQEYPKIVSDGAGGAIVTWYDRRSGLDQDIYAQQVNAAGVPLWVVDGQAVVNMVGDQTLPNIVTDGAGGAIVAWVDERIPGNRDIYAQRLAALGAPMWLPIAGVELTIAGGNQDWNVQFLPMVSDGGGGAIVTWTDARGGPATDIYAQNVKDNGTIGPRTAAGFWRFEEGAGTVAYDASGRGNTGTIIGGAGFSGDIPCPIVDTRFNAFSLDFNPPAPGKAVQIPDAASLRPASGITVEAWVKAMGGSCIASKQYYLTGPPVVDAHSFDLGFYGAMGTQGLQFSLCNAAGAVTTVSGPMPPGDRWSHVAGTWDSTSGTMRLYVDFVEVGSTPFAGPIGYSSNPVYVGARRSGAPGAPIWDRLCAGTLDEVRVSNVPLAPWQMLRTPVCPLAPLVWVVAPAVNETLEVGETYNIQWLAIDDVGVSSVTIEYSATGPGGYTTIATGEPNDGTYTWIVPSPATGSGWIRVTAYDSYGFAGSAELGAFNVIDMTTGVAPRTSPRALTLLPFAPQPFAPPGLARFSMPAAAYAELAIYDAQGRLVRALARGTMPAGLNNVTWDGRDAGGRVIGSGVYFIRLESAGQMRTQSFVVLR